MKIIDVTEQLTDSEIVQFNTLTNRLIELKAQFQTAFEEIATTLKIIRDGRLYRATHPTYEEYLSETWDFGVRRAQQLIASSEVAENVRTIVRIPNEAVARELSKVEKQVQLQIIKAVKKKTERNGKPITAKMVHEEVEHRRAIGGLAAAAIAEREKHSAQPEIDLNLKPKMTPVARAQAAATVSEWWEANKTRCLGYPAAPTSQVVQQIIALFS